MAERNCQRPLTPTEFSLSLAPSHLSLFSSPGILFQNFPSAQGWHKSRGVKAYLASWGPGFLRQETGQWKGLAGECLGLCLCQHAVIEAPCRVQAPRLPAGGHCLRSGSRASQRCRARRQHPVPDSVYPLAPRKSQQGSPSLIKTSLVVANLLLSGFREHREQSLNAFFRSSVFTSSHIRVNFLLQPCI